jgi:hypothetical protein
VTMKETEARVALALAILANVTSRQNGMRI